MTTKHEITIQLGAMYTSHGRYVRMLLCDRCGGHLGRVPAHDPCRYGRMSPAMATTHFGDIDASYPGLPNPDAHTVADLIRDHDCDHPARP